MALTPGSPEGRAEPPPAAAMDGAGTAAPHGPARAGRRTRQPSLSELLKALAGDLIEQLSGRLHLLSLELKRARQALLYMLVLAVTAAILGATAWVALWVVVVTLALKGGLSWLGAALFVLLLNLLGGWLAFKRARALAVLLTLPATLRQLSQAASSGAGADEGHHARG